MSATHPIHRTALDDSGGAPPFAVIGHHRSGTNFLTEILQMHSRVSFIDEPLSMHTRGFPDTDLHRWDAAEYHPEQLHVELRPYPRSREFFHQLVAYLTCPPAGQCRGFKETLLFEKLPWLLSAAPGLRIVHIVRDPRAVIASLLKHDVDRQWRYSERLAAYFSRNPDTPIEPRHATPLDRCITSWRIRQYELRRRPVGAPLLTVRLEDVVLDDARTLNRIMAFLDLMVEDRQIEIRRLSEEHTRGGMYSTYRRREDVLDSWRHRLTPAEQALIALHCKEEMHDLGYSAEAGD
jgi:hypothetical protein